MTDLEEIRSYLRTCLSEHGKSLKFTADTDVKVEATGTIPAMQGKKKVDGMYYASVIPKPKDIRFYFFPLYTHREQFVDTLSPELNKALKGKTCFHFKSLSPEASAEIKGLISKGVELYKADGLLA